MSGWVGLLPGERQIALANEFTPEALQAITLQLRLGAAAVERQLQQLNANVSRGIGHDDPRPLDWAELDRKQFHFLIHEAMAARRGRGFIDLSGLSREELIDLWEFCRYEADRAYRNIDHLNIPMVSGITGEASDYLTKNHRLEGRFFSYVASQIERMVPYEELDVDIGQL